MIESGVVSVKKDLLDKIYESFQDEQDDRFC
jgi:hypothetical protein